MESRTKLISLTLLGLTAAACQQTAMASPPPGAITMAAAEQIADSTVVTWISMDAAKIKALYAPAVVAFDFGSAPLETDRATFDHAQDIFASAKYDKADLLERKIQILAPAVFVVSGTWKVNSTAQPANNTALRCTDVYQKDAAGNWPIINEHCSALPKPA